MKKVAIVMGSDSDLPVVEKAIDTLKEFAVPFEVHVFSAHRTPEQAKAFAVEARKNDFGCVIAAAGKAEMCIRDRYRCICWQCKADGGCWCAM